MKHEVLERADDFLKSITGNDKVCVLHDTDPDGVCSAVIIAKCVERLRNKKVDLRMNVSKRAYGITEEMLETLRKEGITILITMDFSPDQNLDMLNRVTETMRVLAVDHHRLYKDVNSDKVTLIKPQLFTDIEPARYCTAKLAYDLAMRVTDMEDYDWAAAAACIADIATLPWVDWLNAVFEKHGVELQDDLFKTQLGQVATTLSSAEVYDVRLVENCFNVVYEADCYDAVIESELKEYREAIDAEVTKWLDIFPGNAEKHGELYIFEMEPQFKVQSLVSTILGLRYPNNTLVILDKSHEFLRVSARRNDKKIHVNELLEKATEGFADSNAGGHAPAAGAGFHSRDLQKFKERLVLLAGS